MPREATVAGESKITTDHETIRRWAEERGGRPATVKRTGTSEDPGLLRIAFPGDAGEESLEPISWEKFFETFEKKRLAFLYQDKTAEGELSRFNKLISRAGQE